MSLLADLSSLPLDLLFPRRCLACDVCLAHPLAAPVAPSPALDRWLCPECCRRLEPCRPVMLPPGSGSGCRRIYSLFSYGNILKNVIPAWKYHRRPEIFPFIAALLENAVPLDGFFVSEVDLLLPIPLSPRVWRTRGFNQSAFIAVNLARRLELRVETGLLLKSLETPHQASLKRRERIRNLAGPVFKLADPAAVAGRRVLLCDDVMTTGTTLERAAAVLRAAGSGPVSAFTLARTPI